MGFFKFLFVLVLAVPIAVFMRHYIYILIDELKDLIKKDKAKERADFEQRMEKARKKEFGKYNYDYFSRPQERTAEERREERAPARDKRKKKITGRNRVREQ